jgi:hypothetical protein
MTDNTIVDEPALDPKTPLGALLIETSDSPESLWFRISGVLEFLTLRAVDAGGFYIEDDDGRAMVVIAAYDDAKNVKESLPTNIRSIADEVPDFDTNRDPGDEQPDEPATEQE